MRAAALALVAGLLATASADVPATVSFSARLVEEDTGKLVDGMRRISFELFDAEAGGESVWQEGREVMIEDGLLFTGLGENRPLDESVFDGRPLWLEVKLDDVVMEPRIAIDSVPYAIRAAAADKVGDLDSEDVQQRVTGTCASGSYISGVNADGTVSCATDQAGTGDVTAVFAGTGLQGGGNSGDINLSLLQTCGAGQILKWSGSAWQCAPDGGASGGGGDITGVTVGAAGGLMGGGTTGDVTLSLLSTCALNQVLKWSGSTWACANDVDTDTNSGGDMTSVTTAIGSGLQGGASAGDAALSLLTTCAAGQVLKWNGASGWTCGNDIDTDTNSGGDITDVVAGNGIAGGGASGAVTLSIVAGSGITVGADSVGLDFAVADARWVNATGDAMTGSLAMGGNPITNRGCPTLTPGGVAITFVRTGNLCVENPDVGSHTFSQCANRCRNNGAHMCSSAEMRSIIASGITLTPSVLFDWIDDQVADDTALHVNNATDAENPDGEFATNSARWCRCCMDVE